MKSYLFLIFFISNFVYSDYIRTGPVETDQGWEFFIRVFDWKEVDSWEMDGKLYKFPTRFSDKEISEIQGKNDDLCYSKIFRGRNIYFMNERVGRFKLVRFRCEYVK
tara:strand:+ start:916 stop:1236 length:321 start_codon:yes stop_codon:yes gene_type:complete